MTTITDEHLAASLLDAAMLQTGATVTQLSVRTGISRTIIYSYLKGKTQPSYPRLRQLIQAAGMDIEMIVFSVAGKRSSVPTGPMHD